LLKVERGSSSGTGLRLLVGHVKKYQKPPQNAGEWDKECVGGGGKKSIGRSTLSSRGINARGAKKPSFQVFGDKKESR